MFTAFDIEIAAEIPEGTEDWKALRPLGISCAATLTETGELNLWHGAEQPDGRYAERMTPAEVDDMTGYLLGRAEYGAPVITWNGLGFDMDILQEECTEAMADMIHLLARYDHIDMMFQLFCERGFCLGLDAAAKGMGLLGKTEGMHGDLAPKMWAQGREQQDLVLQYVAQDVRTTADLYLAILQRRRLDWTSKSGKPANWAPTLRIVDGDARHPRMMTVDECLRLPEPDTSWMTNPWQRSKFAGWLKPAREVLEIPTTIKPKQLTREEQLALFAEE